MKNWGLSESKLASKSSGPSCAREACSTDFRKLGIVRLYYEWDWSGAEAALRRALELNPNYAWGHEFCFQQWSWTKPGPNTPNFTQRELALCMMLTRLTQIGMGLDPQMVQIR